MNDLVTNFKNALAVSTPLIGINTLDPASVTAQLSTALPKGWALVRWDIARGFEKINLLGERVLKAALKDNDPSAYQNPTEAFGAALQFPESTLLFAHNLHNLITDPSGSSVQVVQALWNLRDDFKTKGAAFVGLGPDISLPPELQQDFVILDEPLPSDEQRSAIIRNLVDGCAEQIESFKRPDEATFVQAVDVTRGMSAFMVEQQTSISLAGGRLDVAQLAERMRRTINSVQGLSLYTGGESFDTMGGLDNARNYFTRLFDNVDYGVIVFTDELEKQFGGLLGDTSGTAQDQLGEKLTWMEDRGITGSMLIGPGGGGKSMLAKALGNYAKIPTIILNLSATKDSLVGSTGRNLRLCFKTIDAVAGNKRIFCIATCNRIAALPPELRRRYTHGTFFVDLPTAAERAAIWPIHLKAYGISPEQEMPNDTDWTGAEIRNCCRNAADLKISLVEASRYIVPIAVSDATNIAALRDSARGKYLSASHPGIYGEEPPVIATKAPGRKFRSN